MKNRAFTLIELLGVIIILSLITLLVLPNISSAVRSKKKDVNKVTEKIIYSAADLYLKDTYDINNISSRMMCIRIEDLEELNYLKDINNIDENLHEKAILATYKNGFEYTMYNSLSECEVAKSTLCVVENDKSFGSTCTYTDLDSSGSITKGDKVTCGTEGFYVIENPISNKVKMLTEWNLNVSEPGDINGLDGVPYSYTYCESTVGYQDSHVRGYLDIVNDPLLKEYYKSIEHNGNIKYYPYGTVKFDSVTIENYGYWTIEDSHDLNTSLYTENNSGEYPAYVYDSNSTLKTFVDTYVGYLNSQVSGANASGRLIKYEELTDLGCNMNDNTCSSSTAPSWVYQTSYWSGSAGGSTGLWEVKSTGDFYCGEVNVSRRFGVRPVIEISKDVIQAS